MKRIVCAAILMMVIGASEALGAGPRLESLTVDQVASTTPSLVQRYAYGLFEAGRVEEAYDLVKAIPDAKLSPKQADLKATRVSFWGKHAAKAKEDRALSAKTPEALQTEAAALTAMGKPSKWDAAFKVATAGAIATPADFDAAHKCLTHFKYLSRTAPAKGYSGSYLNQRLKTLVVAVPAKTDWLYDDGQRWKELLWAKAQAGDASYVDVLAAAASKGVLRSSYADMIFLYGKAKTLDDYDAVKSECRKVLDSLGILGVDAPNREYALYAAVFGLRSCQMQINLCAPGQKDKYAAQAKEWAERIKAFGESAFLGEAQGVLGR